MSFQKVMVKLRETGFKNFESVEYFVKFAENEGSTVSSLSTDRNEYHRAHRHFKLMSDGYKKEAGLGLFKSSTTDNQAQNIELTEVGHDVLSSIVSFNSQV